VPQHPRTLGVGRRARGEQGEGEEERDPAWESRHRVGLRH
jgi:hypothetical protein